MSGESNSLTNKHTEPKHSESGFSLNKNVTSVNDTEVAEAQPSASQQQSELDSDETSETQPIDTIDEHRSLLNLKSTRELERCNQLYYQGQFEDACQGYQALIKNLNDHKLLANLGYSYQALGRHKEAIHAFEKYLETFIARHHAWKAQCYSYYHLKDYENMTRCAREAIRWDIRLNEPDDYSWQQMATAHFLMKDYSTALKAARKASTLNPKNPYSHYYEACIISALVEGAVLDQEDILEQEPSYAAALDLLKTCLEIRSSLYDELKAEGYLDEVFKQLEQESLSEETAQAVNSDTDH